MGDNDGEWKNGWIIVDDGKRWVDYVNDEYDHNHDGHDNDDHKKMMAMPDHDVADSWW